MDTALLIHYASLSAFILALFAASCFITIFIGRQRGINLLCGLLLSTLLFIHLPYLSHITSLAGNALNQAIVEIVIFVILTAATTYLMRRLMPPEFLENKFESLPKKLLVALGLTVLTGAICFSILPVAEIYSTTSPVTDFLAHREWLFWWFLIPVIVLYLQ